MAEGESEEGARARIELIALGQLRTGLRVAFLLEERFARLKERLGGRSVGSLGSCYPDVRRECDRSRCCAERETVHECHPQPWSATLTDKRSELQREFARPCPCHPFGRLDRTLEKWCDSPIELSKKSVLTATRKGAACKDRHAGHRGPSRGQCGGVAMPFRGTAISARVLLPGRVDVVRASLTRRDGLGFASLAANADTRAARPHSAGTAPTIT